MVKKRGKEAALGGGRQREPYAAALAAAKRASADGSPYPTETEISILHERVLAGPPHAVDALIERLLPLLTDIVRRASRNAPEDLIVNAAEDAILEYADRPNRFDRSRHVPLLVYLRLAALRNLSNTLQSESRRRARERKAMEERLAVHGVSMPAIDEGPDDASLQLIQRALASFENPEERAAIALWLRGERRTTPLARALGVMFLPVEHQRQHLKRLKDRVRKRLKRLLHPVKPR